MNLLLSSLLTVVSFNGLKAQNWDDVAFWSADFALNTLQRQAEAEQLETHRQTYVILRDGYKIVRGLVSENHELHEEFFREMASVNPVVENYYKVFLTIKIYNKEVQNIRRDAPQMVRLMRTTDVFTQREVEKVEETFDKMRDQIKDSFIELKLVAIESSDGLDMMDSERIVMIDRLYEESLEITASVKKFRRLIMNLLSQRTNTSVSNLENLFRVRP